jgi:hypothetical protein
LKNILLFGVPVSNPNRNILRRWGVAVLEEVNANGQPALTGARRLAIADGTVPLAEVLLYDSTHSIQSRNFQILYQLNDSGTADFYLGSAHLSDTWWNRIADRIANSPVTGMKYARLQKANGHYVLTVDHNLPAILGPYEGQPMKPRELIELVGLKPL